MEPILKTLADNPSLMEAAKKVILEKFSVDLLDERLHQSDLADQVRARIIALHKVEEAFKDIQKLKSIPEPVPKTNQAR